MSEANIKIQKSKFRIYIISYLCIDVLQQLALYAHLEVKKYQNKFHSTECSLEFNSVMYLSKYCSVSAPIFSNIFL